MMIETSGPNAEQISYWNEKRGSSWVARQALLDGQISPLGLAAMERARVTRGERVLDVGCGCGQTTRQLAERVGADAAVLGVDVSAVMLARAREDAAGAGLDQVRFENADAQTFAFEPEHFDLVFSRFGVMFFSDPTAAFANLRRALRETGRLAFVCWQKLDRNPWMLVPMAAAAQHVELQGPAGPDAPGPFSFADPARVEQILQGAGFRDVAFEELECELTVGGGGTLEAAVDFVLELGPTAEVLRQAKESTRRVVREAVLSAIAPYRTAAGVRMQSASWLVNARR